MLPSLWHHRPYQTLCRAIELESLQRVTVKQAPTASTVRDSLLTVPVFSFDQTAHIMSFALISDVNILDDSISVLGLQVDSWSRL